VRFLPLALYIGLILAANWAVDTWGIVPVGLGLYAPAGVYAVAFALIARDLVQRNLGRAWAIAAIIVGAGLSALISPTLALASGCAFLASETVDMAIFTALQRRFLLAVLISGLVAIVVDSVLFLWLAFDSLEFLEGQLWAKALGTLAGVAALYVWRAW